MERLQKENFFVVDQGILEGDALWPFAFEEVMMPLVGKTKEPIVHIWRHKRAFIAGLRDRRLPLAGQALEQLRARGYSAIVRNSGGAAVPLHDGVVNISVLLPRRAGTLDIYDDFSWMADFIAQILLPLGVSFDRGEVIGSYCPGDYDLSIRGRKFCGIAQRRQLTAYSLQAFIIIEGTGSYTGNIAREFYELAAGGASDLGALQVDPAKMASLHELTSHVTVQGFMESLYEQLRRRGGMDGNHLLKEYETGVREQMQLMRERYDR